MIRIITLFIVNLVLSKHKRIFRIYLGITYSQNSYKIQIQFMLKVYFRYVYIYIYIYDPKISHAIKCIGFMCIKNKISFLSKLDLTLNLLLRVSV